MGLRITDQSVEESVFGAARGDQSAGRTALAERGLTAAPAEEALPDCDVVILALPDNRIGR